MSERNKGRKGKRIASKVCVRCGRVLPLTAFYPNKQWVAQSYHDAWCRECASRACTDKAGIQEYFWYNNRTWSEELYESAVKKARYALANDPDYLDAQKSPEKRSRTENACIARSVFSIMNMANQYHFQANIQEEGEVPVFDPDGQAVKEIEKTQPQERQVYSKVWNGYYTRREIDYLDAYYARLEEGFVLDNESIRDYARKAAKASQDADIKYNRMRQGSASVAEWEKAQAIFDNLSKSANFAACRRKPGDSMGLGSLGAIIQKIEQSGELDLAQDSFPADEIDAIINDFRHITAAIGLDEVSV